MLTNKLRRLMFLWGRKLCTHLPLVNPWQRISSCVNGQGGSLAVVAAVAMRCDAMQHRTEAAKHGALTLICFDKLP